MAKHRSKRQRLSEVERFVATLEGTGEGVEIQEASTAMASNAAEEAVNDAAALAEALREAFSGWLAGRLPVDMQTVCAGMFTFVAFVLHIGELDEEVIDAISRDFRAHLVAMRAFLAAHPEP